MNISSEFIRDDPGCETEGTPRPGRNVGLLLFWNFLFFWKFGSGPLDRDKNYGGTDLGLGSRLRIFAENSSGFWEKAAWAPEFREFRAEGEFVLRLRRGCGETSVLEVSRPGSSRGGAKSWRDHDPQELIEGCEAFRFFLRSPDFSFLSDGILTPSCIRFICCWKKRMWVKAPKEAAQAREHQGCSGGLPKVFVVRALSGLCPGCVFILVAP